LLVRKQYVTEGENLQVNAQDVVDKVINSSIKKESIILRCQEDEIKLSTLIDDIINESKKKEEECSDSEIE